MKQSDIENKIQEADDNYQIKTDAKSILLKYEQKKAAKAVPAVNKRRNKLILGTSLVTAGLVGVITLGFVINTLNNPSTPEPVIDTTNTGPINSPIQVNPQDGVKGGTRSQTAFQVFTGINLLNNISSPTTTGLKMRATYSESDFKKVVDAFDNTYENLKVFLEDSVDIPNTITKYTYSGFNGATYEYKMLISYEGQEVEFITNMSFENDEEDNLTTYTGEIIGLGEFIPVTIVEEYDTEDGEKEVEMEIVRGSTTITIEQEDEVDEKEYTYIVKNSNTEIYRETLKFESEDNRDDLEVEISIAGVNYDYSNIIISQTGLKANYKSDAIEGSFTMTINSLGRLYVDDSSSYQIQK